MLGNFREIQRSAIESLYEGVCTIVNTEDVTDPVTNITKPEDKIIAENEPCRLSYRNDYTMDNSDSADTVRQIIKLFIKPELDIPAGSLFEITQHGKTSLYSNSGYPEVHSSHQEILLTLNDRYGRLYE